MAWRIAKKLEPLSWAVLAFSLGVIVAPFGARWIGEIEGRLLPVVEPSLTIVSVEPVPEGTRVTGRAKKARSCNYIAGSLRWYLGAKDGLFVEVDAEFTDPPQLRERGWTEWSGIIVGLTPEKIQRRSFATVRHDCGWPWLTVSTFYVSP